jgi:chemotaxis signal transduction protein
LGTLVQLRNRLQHRFGKADADVGALTSLLASLKQRVLPHAPGQYFPRLEEVVIVQAGAMRFAIAQSLVREIVRIHEQQRPASLEDGAMMSLHGSWMPRLSLAQRLGKGQPAQEAYALVVQAETGPMALCVEQVEGLAQLMLQPVPRLLRAVPIYRAAAILGDGSPCLLLDTDALLQRRPPAATEAAPAPHAAAPAVRKTPYLLFDDGAPKAMALTQVARVEPVAVSELFAQGGHYEYVRGGRVFRLALLPGAVLPHGGEAQALFLLHAPDCALLAHRVGGIVDAALPPHASHGDFDGITAELVDGSAYFMPEALHG